MPASCFYLHSDNLMQIAALTMHRVACYSEAVHAIIFIYGGVFLFMTKKRKGKIDSSH